LPSIIAYFLSYIALFGLLFIESDLIDTFPNYYQVMHTAARTGYFWFGIGIVSTICIVPEVCLEFFQRTYYPRDWQIVQELAFSDGVHPKTISQIVQEGNELLENTDEEDSSESDIQQLDSEISGNGGFEKKEKEKKGNKKEKDNEIFLESDSSRVSFSSSSGEEILQRKQQYDILED